MNLNEEVNKAFEKVASENLQEMCENNAKKMLEKILDDVFSPYSEVAKQMKKMVESKLNINLERFDLIDYNAIVADAINTHIYACVNENSIQPILKLVESATGLVKSKNIRLSEIHKMVLDAAMEYYSWDNDGEISFHVEHNREHGWYTVSADIEPKDEDKCSFKFMINDKSGSIFSFRTRQYDQKSGVPITPARIVMMSQVEHAIFRLYSACVVVEVDDTEFNKYWSRYED